MRRCNAAIDLFCVVSESPTVKVSPDVIRESSSVKISCETPADVTVNQCYFYTNREEKNIKVSSSCELKRVNLRKAAGPDGITGRVLRSCADQLAGLFTSIFNESLATSVVPTSFKKSIIIPVPKNNKPSCPHINSHEGF